MTHGHGQQGGDGLWELGVGRGGGGQRGKIWDNCNRIIFLKEFKLYRDCLTLNLALPSTRYNIGKTT